MRRTIALTFITVGFRGAGASQSVLLVGRFVDVSRCPPERVDLAKVRVAKTIWGMLTRTSASVWIGNAYVRVSQRICGISPRPRANLVLVLYGPVRRGKEVQRPMRN